MKSDNLLQNPQPTTVRVWILNSYVGPHYMGIILPTHGTTVSPSTGLRPATVVGNKIKTRTRTSPPRPRNGDANGGTQSAEYPTVEGSGIPVTVEGSRESVFEPRGDMEPQTPLRGILAI